MHRGDGDRRLAFAGPAAAATGTVHTDSGASVTVRSGPHVGATAVGSVADGATINITCQTHGDTVTGKYGTSDIWDHISSGYVTDTYVFTGSDGLVAPLCGAQTCSTDRSRPAGWRSSAAVTAT